MISLVGLQISSSDWSEIQKMTEKVERGIVTPVEYNEFLLQIKIKYTRPKTRISVIRTKLMLAVAYSKDIISGRRTLIGSREYRRRMEACRACPHVRHVPKSSAMLCRKCGCLLQAKARLRSARCPDISQDGESRWEVTTP